jgi:release factor glutamine methyltransferase
MIVSVLLAAAGLPAQEARALLAFVLDVPRERLIAHPAIELTLPQESTFRALAKRRAAGTPMAYLLGRQEFYGRAFRVDRAVLVPRPETEALVDLARDTVKGEAAPRLLDLGTGSGCIAVTLALDIPGADVTAVEQSIAALDVARANAVTLGARVTFVESDWYANVEGLFDAIVANPPYVAAGDPHLAALRDEPIDALTDHADGLQHLRAIVRGAMQHLRPGGALLVEHGFDQGAAVRELMIEAGFRDVATHADGAGLERIGSGRA